MRATEGRNSLINNTNTSSKKEEERKKDRLSERSKYMIFFTACYKKNKKQMITWKKEVNDIEKSANIILKKKYTTRTIVKTDYCIKLKF